VNNISPNEAGILVGLLIAVTLALVVVSMTGTKTRERLRQLEETVIQLHRDVSLADTAATEKLCDVLTIMQAGVDEVQSLSDRVTKLEQDDPPIWRTGGARPPKVRNVTRY